MLQVPNHDSHERIVQHSTTHQTCTSPEGLAAVKIKPASEDSNAHSLVRLMEKLHNLRGAVDLLEARRASPASEQGEGPIVAWRLPSQRNGLPSTATSSPAMVASGGQTDSQAAHHDLLGVAGGLLSSAASLIGNLRHSPDQMRPPSEAKDLPKAEHRQSDKSAVSEQQPAGCQQQ